MTSSSFVHFDAVVPWNDSVYWRPRPNHFWCNVTSCRVIICYTSFRLIPFAYRMLWAAPVDKMAHYFLVRCLKYLWYITPKFLFNLFFVVTNRSIRGNQSCAWLNYSLPLLSFFVISSYFHYLLLSHWDYKHVILMEWQKNRKANVDEKNCRNWQ